jgi:hypothetical protein
MVIEGKEEERGRGEEAKVVKPIVGRDEVEDG